MYGPETFATYKAWSSDNTLSGLSTESLLHLGMSLSSTVGHNNPEIPPQNVVKYVAMKGPCGLDVGPCQLPLQR